MYKDDTYRSTAGGRSKYGTKLSIYCAETGTARPQYPKYAEKLTHRDVLGALMHLGIDRGKIGDIICQSDVYYIFCEEMIHTFIMENSDLMDGWRILDEQENAS